MAVQSMLDQAQPVDPLVAAEQAVRRYCGWHVAPVVTETIVARPAVGGIIYLPTLKLVDVLGLKVSGVDLTEDELAAVEWSEDGMLRRPGGWPHRWRSVVATISHGHDDASDAAALIREIAARASIVGAGISGVVVGNRQTRFTAGAGHMFLDDQQRRALDPYRLAEVLK